MRHDFRLVRTLIAALFVGFSSVSSAMELSGATADSGDRFPFEVKYQEKLICSNGAVSAHRGNGGPLRAAESAVSRRASASERRSLATVLYPSLGFIADRARVLGYVP